MTRLLAPPLLSYRAAGRFVFCFACCVVCLLGSAEAVARERALEEDLSELRKFSAILRTPLNRNERHPWLGVFAHLLGVTGKPHLTAVQGLSVIRLPAATFALIDVLEDPNFPYRVAAGLALARNPHPAALIPLANVLNDPDPRLRRTAARALGVVAALTVERDVDIEQVTNRLIGVLVTDSDPAVRVAAFQGIAKYAKNKTLEQAVDIAVLDPDRLVRCGMLRVASHLALDGRPQRRKVYTRAALGNILDSASLPSSVGVMDRAIHRNEFYSAVDESSDCIDVNEGTLGALSLLKFPRITPVLLRLVATSDSGLRATVIRGLARFRGAAAFDAVVAALDDPIAGVRTAAIEGLGGSEHPMAGAALRETLMNGALHQRLAAALALQDPTEYEATQPGVLPSFSATSKDDEPSQWGPAESDALVRAFDDDDARVRQAAEKALGTKPPNAASSLANALRANKAHVRVRAARLLAAYRSPKSLTLLLDALISGQPPQSAAAALALGLRGDERARPALEHASDSEDAVLALAATNALLDLSDRSARSSPPSLPSLLSQPSREECCLSNSR